jgi:hypothetical protein
MTDISLIGMKVRLKKAMLGNPVGEVGYVFSQYPDFDDSSKLGIQIIFPNGEYDGFSVDEQRLYIETLFIDPRYSSYEFSNVMRVWRDYQNKYWRFYE